MQQPTSSPPPVCQPFSRSQSAQWLVRLAVLTLTLAGECFSVLSTWTLLLARFRPMPAPGMHIRKATHHPLCLNSAGIAYYQSRWTCPGRQGSCGDQCVQGHHGPRCSQKDGDAHRHVTSLHSMQLP